MDFPAFRSQAFRANSESRTALRDFFEVDTRHIVWATLVAMARDNRYERNKLPEAAKKLKINQDKPNQLIT